MLRRQMIRPMRRPLIVMTPKSLLRHKQAVSDLEELANGRFYNVLDETDALEPDKVTRVVICGGKVYYDLRDMRRKRELDHIAIIRIEQLYPFPEDELFAVLDQYPNLAEVYWCQEEPKNQGAWYNSQHHLRDVVYRQNASIILQYTGREASAAPATGHMALHLEQQEQLINEALGPSWWTRLSAKK
jgi:2-oxoglutarate dehydrogenase E1 component